MVGPEATVDGGSDASGLRGKRRHDELVAVRGEQPDRVGAAHAEMAEEVGGAVDDAEQLAEGEVGVLAPPRSIRQHGDGWAARRLLNKGRACGGWRGDLKSCGYAG